MLLPKSSAFLYSFVLFSISFLLFLVLSNERVSAASFYINPATGQVSSEKFSVTITVDPEGSSVKKASVYLSYDTSAVEVSVINNGIFSSYTSRFNDPTTGIIHVEAENTAPLSDIVNFVVIEFVNLKKTPTIDLELLTTPTYKSVILDNSGTNILTTSKSAILNNTLYNKNTSQVTNSASPSLGVPETGYDFIDYRFLILLSGVLSFTSLFIRSHAKSKY